MNYQHGAIVRVLEIIEGKDVVIGQGRVILPQPMPHHYTVMYADGSKHCHHVLDLYPFEHTNDKHCVVDSFTGLCLFCGVGHNLGECADCHGTGFHELDCPTMKQGFDTLLG